MVHRLSELHGDKERYTIPNGYDPDIVNKGTALRKEFNIVYAGVLYKGRRDPEPLFRAVQELIAEGLVDGKDMVLDFYGDNDGWLNNDIARYALQGIARAHGVIPREDVLMRERESQLLLLLMWNNPEERGNYTGKVFEYLAAQRPILSLGGKEGVVVELLKSSGTGVNVTDHDEVKKQIMEFYSEYKTHGAVGYHGDMSVIGQFSHKEMARKFSKVLEKITT
jgi:glycosyltransferase involved in cell wall biosynthesis